MIQDFSLHTHTIGFDGKNSVSEMVEAAENLGLKKLGISNHFIVHPNIKNSNMYQAAFQRGYHPIYSSSFHEAIEKFKPHYAEIDEVKQKTGFKIYKGMEVDFFGYDGFVDEFQKALEILKPDYLIGSAHFVVYNDQILNSHDLKHAGKEEQNILMYKYYQNLRAAAKSGLFDFLAHLDLMKKVGLGLDERYADIERYTVQTIADAGAKVEINTSGFKLNCAEPYPGKRIMAMLGEYNIPVVLSDDAHNKERLCDHFKQAKEMALDTGIKTFCDFDKTSPLLIKKCREI